MLGPAVLPLIKVLLVNTDYQDASEGSCVQSTLGSFANISSLVFV